MYFSIWNSNTYYFIEYNIVIYGDFVCVLLKEKHETYPKI